MQDDLLLAFYLKPNVLRQFLSSWALWSHWNEQCFANKIIYTGNSTWFQICLLHGMWEPDYETTGSSSCLQEIQLPVICFGSFIITLVLGMYLLGKALNHGEQLVIPSRELTYPTWVGDMSLSGSLFFEFIPSTQIVLAKDDDAHVNDVNDTSQCMDNLLNRPWVNSPGFF